MGSFKNIIFLSAAVLVILANGAAGIEFEKVTSKNGGGECDTDLDCSNQGRCLRSDEDKPDDPNKGEDDEILGKCFCFEGIGGKNCEKTTESSRRQLINGEERNENQVLEFQTNSPATGLNPKELAAKNQEFLIYNPRVGRFWIPSTKSPRSGDEKNNYFMVVEQNYRSGPKRFKLKDLGNGEYNIITLTDNAERETGFVYLSEITKGLKTKSRRVMSSARVDDKSAYKFTFTEHSSQKGNFQIKCNGQTLYASIGGYNVKADNRYKRAESDEIWFQLNLYDDAGIKTTTKSTRKDIFAESMLIKLPCVAKDNTGDDVLETKFNKAKTKTEYETKLKKLGLTGTGGVKDGPLNLGLTLAREKTNTHGITLTSENEQEMLFKIPAHKRMCFEFSYKEHSSFNQLTMDVEFNNNKFKGFKLEEVSASDDVSVATKLVEIGQSCDE